MYTLRSYWNSITHSQAKPIKILEPHIDFERTLRAHTLTHERPSSPCNRFSGLQICWHLACSMREGYKCSDTCRAKFVRLKKEETIILKTYQHIMYTPSTDRYTNNLDKPVVFSRLSSFFYCGNRAQKYICESLPSTANRVHTIARSQYK